MATTTYAGANTGGQPEDFAVIIGRKTDNSNTDTVDMTSEDARLGAQYFEQGKLDPGMFNMIAGTGTTLNIGTTGAKEDIAIVEGATGAGNYIVRRDSGQIQITLPSAPTFNQTHRIYLVVHDRQYDTSGRSHARIAWRSQENAADTVGPDPDWDAFLPLGFVIVQQGATNIGVVQNFPGPTQPYITPGVSAAPLAIPRFTVPQARILDFDHTHTLNEIPATSAKGALFAWTTGWGGAYDTDAIIPITGRAQVFSVSTGTRRLEAADSLPNGNSGFSTVGQFFDAWERIISLETVIFQGGANEPLRFSRQTTANQFGTVSRLPRTVFSPADHVGATNQPTTLRMDFDMVRFSGQNPGILPVLFEFDHTNRVIRAWVNSNTQRTEDRDVFVPTSTQATRMTRFQVNVHYEAARTI